MQHCYFTASQLEALIESVNIKRRKMIAYFERFEIKMTLEQAKSVSHQGACDEDVKELLKNKKYLSQFKKIEPSKIIAELQEYGAWDLNELLDHEANLSRITWIAGGNIIEDYKEKRK
jgi:hypothetical protein